MLGRLYEKAHPKPVGVSDWTFKANANAKEILSVKKDYSKPIEKQQQWEKPKDKTVQPKKFMTTEEMNDRRSKGLCYFCDEKYSPAHAQTHRKTQLYLLELEEDVQGEFEEEIVEQSEEMDIATISLNAVAGHSDYTTMRVKGSHEKGCYMFC